MGLHVAQTLASDGELDTGCAIKSVHPGWMSNGFMVGPISTCLMVPVDGLAASAQQTALDKLALQIERMTIRWANIQLHC